jgi:hypothetical protein
MEKLKILRQYSIKNKIESTHILDPSGTPCGLPGVCGPPVEKHRTGELLCNHGTQSYHTPSLIQRSVSVSPVHYRPPADRDHVYYSKRSKINQSERRLFQLSKHPASSHLDPDHWDNIISSLDLSL